jgi:hypothetical protein
MRLSKFKKFPILKNKFSLIQMRSYAKKQPADIPDKPASDLYNHGPEGYLFPGKVKKI